MNTNINRCISKAFNQYGYSVELTDEEVEFPPLKIWITGQFDMVEEKEDGSFQSRLIIRTRHQKLFPDGIFEYAYGGGESEEEASVNAAFRWIESDFNTIHDLLCTSAEHDHSDSKTELISFNAEGGLIAWDVVFGPLIRTASEQVKEDVPIDTFLMELFNLINGTLLHEKEIYPIKCFVMTDREGEISMDCRVNGRFWEEGEAVLKEYAEKWGLKNEFHWRKQYFIIVPKNLEELRNPELLVKIQETEHYKSLDKREKTFTVDNETFASNPGNAKLNPWVWTKSNLIEVGVLFFALLVSLFLTIGASYGFAFMTAVVIFYHVYYWTNKKEHFKLGDSNGGIVVSVNPTLVAVTTNLTKGFGDYPVVKIIKYKTSKPVKIGDRIATVALYSASNDDELPHWIDFNPIPLDYATNDKAEIERALSSYSDQQWKDIERRVAQLPKPLKVGLFKVDMNESDWKSEKSKSE